MSLFEDFLKLVNSGEYSDVFLKCDDKVFSAHRAILATRSPVFSAMFRSDMKEAREQCVEIRDIKPDVLEKLLCYVYTGNVDLPKESVHEVYRAADMYCVEALTAKCLLLITDSYAINSEKDSQEAINAESGIKATNDDAESGVKETNDEDEQKELLKDLFLSTEWQALATRYPKLAGLMCKPLLLGKAI